NKLSGRKALIIKPLCHQIGFTILGSCKHQPYAGVFLCNQKSAVLDGTSVFRYQTIFYCFIIKSGLCLWKVAFLKDHSLQKRLLLLCNAHLFVFLPGYIRGIRVSYWKRIGAFIGMIFFSAF